MDVIFHKQHSKGTVLPKFIQHICSVFLAHTDFLQKKISNMQILPFVHSVLAQGNMCSLLFRVLCSDICVQRNKIGLVGLGNRSLLAGFSEACGLVVLQLSASVFT